MRFIDLYPFVLPYAQHLPNETALHHIRLAAARFFGATHAWQLELDPMTASAGKTSYSMNIEQNTDLAYLMDVTVNGGGEHPMAKVPAAGFDATTTLKRSDFGVTAELNSLGDEIPISFGIQAARPAP